ncbi:MAG: glycosyltransferase family 4 protein [Acidimicrobiales bacterium]
MLFSHSPNLGGAERTLAECCEVMTAGHEVHVVVPSTDGLLHEHLGSCGAEIHVARQTWWIDYPRPVYERVLLPARTTARLARDVTNIVGLLRQVRPSVALTNTLASPAAAIGCAVLGIPHIWFAHEYVVEDHGLHFQFGRNLSMRLVAITGTAHVACSDSLAKALSSRLRRHVATVDAAVEDRWPRPAAAARPSDSALRILVVGTLQKGKGQRLAVAIARILKGRGVPILMTVVGPDPYGESAHLGALIGSFGLAEQVRILGPTSDLGSIYDDADVLLVPSEIEALGRATIEAQKRGLAVVGSASGGTAALLDGGCGVLFAPGDAHAAAEAVAEMWRNRQHRAAIAERGRRAATQRYSAARLSSQLDQMFDAVAG